MRYIGLVMYSRVILDWFWILGLSISKGVHSNAGSAHRNDRRILANVVGTQLYDNRHDDKIEGTESCKSLLLILQISPLLILQIPLLLILQISLLLISLLLILQIFLLLILQISASNSPNISASILCLLKQF